MSRHTSPWSSRALVLALAVPAALRLTRFITKDWLGEWTIVRPVQTWAYRHEAAATGRAQARIRATHDPIVQEWQTGGLIEDIKISAVGWRGKLAHSLNCPFCAGFWVTLATLAVAAVCPKPVRPALAVLFGALGANYAIAHISSRID